MRIYLDTSVYNRPFDNQRQPRIWLEALALGVILQMIEAGDAELVDSAALEYETDRNPSPMRQQWVNRCRNLSVLFQPVNVAIQNRASELEHDRITPMDALHLASAEYAKVDDFLTCDDRLIRRYKGVMRVQNPANFVLASARR